MHLRDVVAIITGGARGFGKVFSEAVLKGGGKVCQTNTPIQAERFSVRFPYVIICFSKLSNSL